MSRACIPFHILFDKELSQNELRIYGLIEHFESNGKAVFFNNRTIAEKLGVSHESGNVRKMISRLSEKGYIKREHKEIQVKRKGNIVAEWRWCFSTVKAMIIESDSDDMGGSLDNPPLTGVAEEPPLTGVAEEPPYTNPSFTSPLTTTTCSSSFNPFETKCLEFKHSTDERTPEEFIENIHHHVKFNSDPESGEYQRQQMILKLLRTLMQNAAHFKSKGFVSKQTVKETIKKQEINHRINEYNEYTARIKADINLKLLPEDVFIADFKEWDLNRA